MRMIGIFLKFVAVVSGAVLLERTLYTTEIGNRILRLVPDEAWNTLNERLGLEGAETTANAEIVAWLVICLTLSALVVLGGGALLRRALRRPSQTRIDGDQSHRD